MEGVDVEWKTRICLELHALQERRNTDYEHTGVDCQLHSRQPREVASMGGGGQHVCRVGDWRYDCSDLLVSRKMGQDIIAAILGDIERLHGNEQDKNFELG